MRQSLMHIRRGYGLKSNSMNMKFIYGIIINLLFISQAFCQTSVTKIILENGIMLTGTISTFEKSKHTYDTCGSEFNWKYICLIDGKQWYGTDHDLTLPRNQLTQLTINIHGKEISLETTGMFNISPDNNLPSRKFHLSKNGEDYLLQGIFSDGAGTYIVQWKIIRNTSQRIKISNNEADFD